MKNKILALAVTIMFLTSTFLVACNIKPVRANAHALVDTTYYVSNSGDDSNSGNQTSPWQHIQYAVTHVGAGDTIIVEAGTYHEQVVIGKSLALQGSGASTVIAPSSLTAIYDSHWFGNGMVAGIIVANAGGGSVTVKNLKVDGSGITAPPAGADNVAGIFYLNTGGTIDTVTVENIVVGVGGTSLRGDGIILSAKTYPVSVEVEDSTIINFDKNGIEAEGSYLTVNIHNNTVTGRGYTYSGDEVQNGIIIRDGATGTVNYNTISNLAYYPLTWWACGIMFYNASGSADSNVITNCQMGILFQDGNGSANSNYVDGGTVGLLGLYAQYYYAPAGTYTISFTGNTVTGQIESLPGYVNEAIGGATYEAGVYLTITIDSNQLTYGSATADGIQIGDTVADGAAGSVTAAIIRNNVSNWLNGIEFFDTVDYANTYVTLNNIAGNTGYGITNSNTTLGGTINAERNWWGSATGPGPVGLGSGDKISSNVDYALWLEKEYSSTETSADYLAAIISAANRLVALQSPTDFGWDWTVTGLTSHTSSNSATNLYGVTALGLVDAYVLTGDSAYLTAAENTAAFMMYGNPSAGDFYHGYGSYRWGYSFDYEFLMELSTVSKNPAYSNYALAAWAWQKANRGQYYGDGNQSALWDYYANQWIGTNMSGAAAWGTSAWGLAALAMDDTVWAEHMAALIDANMANILTGNRAIDYVDMGMGETLRFLVALGNASYTADINNLVAALKADQLSDNSWDYGPPPPGDPQTTAYVVMGLLAAGDHTDALKGANWLVATQLTSPSGGWLEWDGNEYSEIDSEALQALTGAFVHPAISISKSGPTYAHVGDVITYNITVTNIGNCPLFSVSVLDNVLGNLTGYFSATLMPSQSSTYYASYTVPSGVGAVTNTVTATYADAAGTEASATTSFTVTVQYQITVTANPTGAIGGTFDVTYKEGGITHTNVQEATTWSEWIDSGTTVTVSNPQNPINDGPGTRCTFDHYEPSASVTITSSTTITLVYKTQYYVTFGETGVGSDFAGTVVTINGTNYGVGGLPVSFWCDKGSTLSFSFASPLTVDGIKQYTWSSTTGLTNLQSDPLTVTASGSVTGNYILSRGLVLVISPSKTVVGRGFPVLIEVTVKNTGSSTERCNVTINLNGTYLNVQQTATLAAGNSTTLVYLWNTTGYAYGSYTLSASAMIIPGEPAIYTYGTVKVTIPGDINGDRTVNWEDLGILGLAYNSSPGSSNWNPNADINGDGVVNWVDLGILGLNYGKSW
jgi:uncharacterized repeat protein (TIGR01451 family)